MESQSIASLLYYLFQCLTMLMVKDKEYEKKSYHLNRIPFAKTWYFCILSCHCALLRSLVLSSLYSPHQTVEDRHKMPLSLLFSRLKKLSCLSLSLFAICSSTRNSWAAPHWAYSISPAPLMLAGPKIGHSHPSSPQIKTNKLAQLQKTLTYKWYNRPEPCSIPV